MFCVQHYIQFIQMFQMKIENPVDETAEIIEEISLFDFERIQLKFKKNFYEYRGINTDRTQMKMEELSACPAGQYFFWYFDRFERVRLRTGTKIQKSEEPQNSETMDFGQN